MQIIEVRGSKNKEEINIQINNYEFSKIKDSVMKFIKSQI